MVTHQHSDDYAGTLPPATTTAERVPGAAHDSDGPARATADVTAALAPALGACQRRVAQMERVAGQALATWRRFDSLDQQHAMRALADSAADLRLALERVAALHALAVGRTSVAHTSVELGDALMGLLARWKPLAPAHSFELALLGELPPVLADQQLAADALHLLIESAVRLSPDGGTVRVELRARTDDVQIAVGHPGVSLTPAQLDELDQRPLEPLDTVDSLALPAGLALARAIIAAHGGGLRAEPHAEYPGGALLVYWPLIPLASSPAKVASGGDADHLADTSSLRTPGARPVVLLCDHDVRMLRYLRANLEVRHYRPLVASEADEAVRVIDAEDPDLIISDPGDDPAAWLVRLRDRTPAPVILLPRRHDPQECAQLLAAGAADYLARPFHLDELLARMQVALRRQAAARAPEAAEPVFRCDELEVDIAHHRVSVAGRAVNLSRTEFRLLRELVRHAGMVLTHETLLERVWGPAYGRETGFIWVYIRRLRRKLEPDPAHPRYILTVPGVGYRLANSA
jgi:DNA-binding response OmpR family regulator